jgi:hypothetical protein
VERDGPDGVVDWSALRLRVNGVGTPVITSPTGAITPRDLYEAARDDARARLERALAAIPVDDQRTVGDVAGLEPRRHVAVEGFTSGDALHFSDGTVHLPASLSFAWVVDALAAPPASPAAPASAPAPASISPETKPAPASAAAPPSAAGKPADPPTGLILVAHGRARPALRVRVESDDGKRFVYAGLRGDPVAPAGAAWVSARADADASPLAGKHPLVLEAEPGDRAGVLRLTRRDAARFFGSTEPALPGGVVVVTR